MRIGHVLMSLALGLGLISATPLTVSPKSASLPLNRPFSAYESEYAQGSLPLELNGIESLVYTVDVQVGSQRFNLTLDTNAWAPVLFAKGFVASNRSCSNGDAQRNLFDPSLSQTFMTANVAIDGWYLSEFPYVGVECNQALTNGGSYYDGVQAFDTYQFGELSVPDVPFVLANHTSYPLNPRWASDGILALTSGSSENLQPIFDALGGGQEVSLFLNNARHSDKQPVPGGRITFGGKNNQDCSDKWIMLEADDTNWSLSLNSVTIGSSNIDSFGFAGISTSTPFLKTPPWFYRPVVNALGGRFSDDLNLYTVDCRKVDSLPPITISMGSGFSVTYDVTAQDYVAKINSKNGVQCALLIVQGEYDGWLVGTQFLPKRCVHLDFAHGQIGFAEPKNTI